MFSEINTEDGGTKKLESLKLTNMKKYVTYTENIESIKTVSASRKKSFRKQSNYVYRNKESYFFRRTTEKTFLGEAQATYILQ